MKKMTILEIRETISPNSKNKISRKELVIKCNWCQILFERKTNVSRTIKKTVHFCSNVCAGKYKMKNIPQVHDTIGNLYKFHEKIKNDNEYAKEVKTKKEQTCLEKYGTKTPLQNKEIQKRCKATLKKNYGVDNPLKSKVIEKKVKKTNLEKYGHEYQITSEATRAKIIKVFKQKYNSTSPAPKKYKIEETKEYLIDWLKKQGEHIPTRNLLYRTFSNETVPLSEAKEMLTAWRSNKTRLEHISEQLFEIKHFNKKPKKISKLYRPDFKLSPQIFLNVDGLYWHSELQKNKWYHFKLREEFERVGLRIFQFREDEIRDNSLVVKSIVDNALGKTSNRIFARKCKTKIVSQKVATKFLAKNHLMGSINAKHLGLFHEEQLVSLLSYKQRQKKNICKIERFCSLIDYSIVGAFSKLLKHLEKNKLSPEVTEIHNWVDLRYGTGNHLRTKGFELKKETLGWKWTDGTNAFNRLKCRANMDERKLTQQEYADELGWIKIYDAGQRLFVKQIIN